MPLGEALKDSRELRQRELVGPLPAFSSTLVLAIDGDDGMVVRYHTIVVSTT